MIPGNVDPRRPDKVQRYKPSAAGSSSGTGEDMTPDYMNILGRYFLDLPIFPLCFTNYSMPLNFHC